jgi:hypothetical protein
VRAGDSAVGAPQDEDESRQADEQEEQTEGDREHSSTVRAVGRDVEGGGRVATVLSTL